MIKSVLKALMPLLLVASVAHAQQNPVTVGSFYPIKTMLGQQAKRGADLAVEWVNASGGVLPGRPLKLIIYDDNFTPTEGVSAARRLASEDKVKILVGGITSAVTMAVMQVVQQNDMLFFVTSAKAPAITENPKAFRFNPLVATEGEVFNKYLRDDVKASRVAIVVENGDYGRNLIADMKKSFGDKVVDTELFEILKQTDFSTLASRVKASNPDLVCLAFSAPEQGGSILRTLKEAGVPGETMHFPRQPHTCPASGRRACHRRRHFDGYLDADGQQRDDQEVRR
jgi:branched-chain amino acid transport system substrate-binding protein